MNRERLGLLSQKNYSAKVAWVLIALLAAIFVIATFVDESFKSGALYLALIATLAALALIGFQNRRNRSL